MSDYSTRKSGYLSTSGSGRALVIIAGKEKVIPRLSKQKKMTGCKLGILINYQTTWASSLLKKISLIYVCLLALQWLIFITICMI